MQTAVLLPNAVGTRISGNAQVINAGGNVNNYRVLLPPADLNELLRPVSNATVTRSGSVARCDPGTRLEVITLVKEWLNGSGKQAAVCWLNGPAGYGKSALAQTIAERYAAKGRLLGSFFFLRGAGQRSNISCLIPTLAHQISLSIPATKPLLEKALQDESALLAPSVSFAHQFQKLIINPICSTTSKIFSRLAKRWILVIDALDECDDKAKMADFIDVLINASGSGLPFRMLLTSRVEEHIRKRFDNPGVKSVLYHLDLRTFNARPDIKTYLERQFDYICNQNLPVLRYIPRPWPTPKALDMLLDKTGSSFVFAATLVQLVRSSTMPDEALQRVLSSEITNLDPLYTHVLSNAYAAPPPAFDKILGTIMLLSDNHSILFLSSLLCLQPKEIVCGLLGVQSIVKIPGDDAQPVVLYHTSLRDFLTNKSRSRQYFIDPPMRHIYLVTDCLKCLKEDSSGDFFDGDAKRYACLEWPHHTLLGFQEQEPILDKAMSDSLVSLIEDLLTLQGKTWYNTLLCGKFEDEEKMLETLKAGKALFQILQRSIVAKTLSKLFKEVIDFHEMEKSSFLKWESQQNAPGYGFPGYHRYGRGGPVVYVHKKIILAWRKETKLSTN